MKSLMIIVVLLAPVLANDRIVGGYDVDIKDFPYQVSLRIHGQHICGGSIIAASKILTAAHCIQSLPAGMHFAVYAGGNLINSTVQFANVKKMIPHENFNGQEYDVAIFELETPLNFNSNVSPIGLQPDSFNEFRKPGIVSGWGYTESGKVSLTLKAVTVDTLTNFECQNMLNNQVGCSGCIKIKNTQLCAGGLGPDSCVGDSGGPLIYQNGNEKFQIGIVSYGFKCGVRNYPGIYSNIKYLSKWIKEKAGI